MTMDLFDAPILPGLATAADLVSAQEERALIDLINGSALSPFRFQGWTGKRLTASFGWSYDFETQRAVRADPIPDWLLPIRAGMAAFARLEAASLIQALIIRYDPGAGIGWHRDRPIYEHVLGLSLGARADMRFRRRRSDGTFCRVSVPLEPRSAYHLSGASRDDWEHSIVGMDQSRWSVTFRSASEKGRSALGLS
jgi:alkylated DNA repair dioxygenase AlkB